MSSKQRRDTETQREEGVVMRARGQAAAVTGGTRLQPRKPEDFWRCRKLERGPEQPRGRPAGTWAHTRGSGAPAAASGSPAPTAKTPQNSRAPGVRAEVVSWWWPLQQAPRGPPLSEPGASHLSGGWARAVLLRLGPLKPWGAGGCLHSLEGLRVPTTTARSLPPPGELVVIFYSRLP